MSRTGLFPLMLLLGVTGCDAGPMGTIRPVQSQGSAVTSFDGSYRNTLHVSSASVAAQGEGWCLSPGQPVITVTDGQFSYAVPHPNVPGNPTPVFHAVMAQDGSFAGQIPAGSMSGHVTGSHMEGTIAGSGCDYAFTGDRM